MVVVISPHVSYPPGMTESQPFGLSKSTDPNSIYYRHSRKFTYIYIHTFYIRVTVNLKKSNKRQSNANNKKNKN